MKKHKKLDLNENENNCRRSSSPEDKLFFVGDDSDEKNANDGVQKNVPENDLPKIFITNETEKSSSTEKDDKFKIKSIHGSWPNVGFEIPDLTETQVTKEKFLPLFNEGDFKSVLKSSIAGKSLEEEVKTIVKLVTSLQNVAKSIAAKHEKHVPSKSNKQLNFRSHDDIIHLTRELTPTDELIKVKKEPRLFMRPEDAYFHFRSKNRIDSPLSRDSSQFFFENERLLDGKFNGFSYSKWNDANSLASPCSTVPDSIFESTKKSKSQSVIYPKRSVLKNGECNVWKKSSNSKRRIRYLQDIFTTLVDVKWRWTLVVFALSFIMSWLFYAGIYWLIAYAHGDFEHLEDENWKPCVENLFNFASCFLFSVETQHTIGYGGRATNEECPEAIFVMCIQSITGVMISAFLAGIFFAKMSRPKQRRQTLLFSRKAVICQRDTQLCLMFRVGDMRKSHIIGTNIRAHIFRTRTTTEGEELPQYQCELQVTADGCESNLFFIWPLTVVHIINKNSPLYTISAQELIQEDFEIVAILEGTVESTGQTTQARTSYLPNEIKWGHRFESILSYNTVRQCYEIDYKKFNNTSKVATPLCSAKDLDELYLVQSEICECNVMNLDSETDNR